MKRCIWTVCGAAGLWLGMPNPLLWFPAAALLYPVALLALGISATSWKSALRQGWLCGMAGSAACLYWLAIPVHDFGGLPWVLAAPCALLMGAYVGLYGGLFAALAHAFRTEPVWRRCLALGVAWYVLEWVRGWFLTGFPWLALASAFTPWTPFIQLASVIGAYGLGGLLAGLSCLAAEGAGRLSGSSRASGLRLAGLAAAGFALIAAYGFGALSGAPSGGPARYVALAQGSLNQDVKWEPAMQRLTVKRYLSLSREALSVPAAERPELLIWPETAMPFDYQRHAELPALLRQFARETGTALLIGAPGFRPRADGEADTFNRAYLISPTGADLGWYDKAHLVPFGEYVPPYLDIPFLRPLLQGVGEFVPGERTGPLTLPLLSGKGGLRGSDAASAPLSPRAGDAASGLFSVHAGGAGKMPWEGGASASGASTRAGEAAVPSSADVALSPDSGPGDPRPGEATRAEPLASGKADAVPPGRGQGFPSRPAQDVALSRPEAADGGPLVLGVLICYESIFPELAREQVAQGANLLVNISNDAWFGLSAAPEQHFSLAVLRAVEQRRWLARATNTGISAFVDPYGNVTARTGLFRAESLSHAVVPLAETTVFFALEPWLPWIGLALLLGLAALARRLRPSRGSGVWSRFMLKRL